jgi:two-component system sensor histidine kinase ChiS
MRLQLSSRYAQILLGLIVGFVGFFLLATPPNLSQETNPADAASSPIEITQNWQYSWNYNIADESQIVADANWQPLAITEPIFVPQNQETIWLRVPLPPHDLDYPHLYIRGIPNLVDAYFDRQKIYSHNRLDESGQFIPSQQSWPIVSLHFNSYDREDFLYFLAYVKSASTYQLIATEPPVLGVHIHLVKKAILRNVERVVLGFFFVLCGLLPLLISIFKKNYSIYRAFGFLCLTVGIYTITKIDIIRILFNQNNIVEYIHHITFYFIPFAVAYFFDRVFESDRRSFTNGLWKLLLLSAILSFFLLFTGFIQPGKILYITQFSGLVGAFILIAVSWRNCISGSIEAKLFAAGFSIFLLSAVYDLINYLLAAGQNKTSFYDWGLLLFIGCLVIILERRFTEANRQLKKYAVELKAKNEELKQLDKLKDEFIANTSHELRTPLNGIIGIAESLIDGVTGELPDPTISNLSLVVYSGRRLTQMVNDLLDFSQLQHKTIDLSIKPIGMREMTEIVLKISQPLIGNKPLKLINDIPTNVPLVDADENRVQQILSNLVSNGIKFTKAGEVRVSSHILDNFLAITVSDTGIGISQEKFERIFVVFEQGDGSIARQYGGAGLGLAISKQLVELHGGKIWVESTAECGSKFTFSLPLSKSKVAAPVSSTISKVLTPPESSDRETINAQITTVPSQGSFSILIVDDDPVNRQVLINYLSLDNYGITQAADGIEALELINNGLHADLVLLDIMMPKMTGYEVCQRLRKQYSPGELPIVLLTAKIQVADLVEGFDSGANDYLTKPISKNELLARLKTHLQLSKMNIAYGRFVPHEFLKFLQRDSIVEVKLGDQVQQTMSVLFSDIRSFTTLSESMSPKDNFDFLNAYLSRVGPIIRNHQGFVDKYIGDAVMALFPESADDALRAGIEMQKRVLSYNAEVREKGYPAIAIGIGIHTGNLMLGTIGEEQRMESTVISDAVNLASRLEGLTKTYGAGLIISDRTLLSLENPEQYCTRFLGSVMVKGKRQPVSIFEVYDADSDRLKNFKKSTKSLFEQAVIFFQDRRFEDADLIFSELQNQNSQDKVIQLYRERCRAKD